jgi:predicted metal-dependent hydrolase
MTIERQEIVVSGVRVMIVRKDIKNLHLGVYPPNGRVRVATPLRVSDEAVRLAVVGKLGWIRRQQGRFEDQSRQSERQMVNGESHYFLGHRYRLRVVPAEGRPSVLLRGKTVLELQAPPRSTAEERRRVLCNWYRRQLRTLAAPLVEKWQARLQVQVESWSIRKMKTKWGTCNREARRIWLNLELAKKPEHCLEYILVHELAHLIERVHSDRFIAIMDEHLPGWRLRRAELNAAPLAHETWTY